MTQIGFKLSEAHEALDQFLNGDRDHGGGPVERWIAKDENLDSGTLAYIVPAGAYHEMSNGYRSWREAQEVREEDDGLPPGYRPWEHSPLATTDRMMPTEPLQEPLAWYLFGKKYAELDEKQRHQVFGAAISVLLRVTLDRDGQGAVPILAVNHDDNEPGRGMRWQIAFATGVPGLFVRMTRNGFFGEEFGIMTGSGFRVADGYMDRESAVACAEALGRTLPSTDWMRLAPDDFTPAAQKAVVSVIRRYQRWGLNEKEAEPQVMTETVPARPEPGLEGRPADEPLPFPGSAQPVPVRKARGTEENG